jgi:hypothetical protein
MSEHVVDVRCVQPVQELQKSTQAIDLEIPSRLSMR